MSASPNRAVAQRRLPTDNLRTTKSELTVPTGTPARRRRLGRSTAELMLLAPILLLVIAVVLVPSGDAILHSFTNWTPGYKSPFVGIANYRGLIHSSAFAQILENEGIYLLGLPIWVLLPLVIAVMLHDRVPAAGLLRTIYFFPSILAPALLGVLFHFVLAQFGLVNSLLATIGLDGLQHAWLQSPGLVKPTIIVILAWAGMGTGVVIFAAGLSGIPSELFEAADIDGASWFQRLRYVVIPQLRPMIELWVLVQVISVFLFLFAWIYVLTQGGPGFASTTLDYDVYQNSIQAGFFGTASAEAVFTIGIVVTVIALFVLLRRLASTQAFNGVRSHLGDLTEVPLESAMRPFRQMKRRISSGRPRMRSRRYSVGRLLILLVVAAAYVYPFFFLVSMAIRPTQDYASNPLGFPVHFTLAHLRTAWDQANLGSAVVNSFIAVGVGVLVTVVTSTLAAFWLRRHPGRAGSVVLASVVAVWLVPVVIYILPLFVTLSRLSLTNNLFVLGVIYAALNVPFGLYFLTAYYRDGIPNEVLEAAQVDGASIWRTFRSVVLPLSRPALGALAALAFVWSWGDLLIAVIMLSDPSKYTVTVAAAAIVGRFDFDIQTQAASAVIAMVPMLLVFLIAQRAIVRGFTTGFGK